MAFSLTSDVEFLKKLPAYTPILKTVLKAQIQLLVNQLSEYGGEECVFLTASLSDGTLSHIGSKSGQGFLESHGEFKSKFLQFCLGRDIVPVNFMDMPTYASKKVSKKHQTCTKGKYSASSNNSGSKKFRTQPALQETNTENAEKISFKGTKDSLVDRISGNCTDLSSKETNVIDKTVNVLCPSLEACQLEKESEEKCMESMTDQNSSCLRTDANYAVDNHDTKEEGSVDDDGTVADVVEAETGDESNDVDECDNRIKEEEDIIIKIEPIWDSETDTVDTNGRIISEGYSDDSLSNLEKEMSRPFTSSGNPPAHLQADFLCCNDDQIWVKNSLPKQKRSIKSVSLWTKYNAIKQVEQGGKKRCVIANELGVPKSTLSTWLKNADTIKGAINDSQISLHRKKRRFSNHYEIEEALLEWLKIVHLQAVVPKITAVNICDKANQLAKQFGYTPATFQCTKAWVERFKTRHGFKKNFVRADICNGDT